MASKARDEIMVRDSIEAKGDEDVDMEDAPAATNGDGDGDGEGEHTGTEAGETSQMDGAADGDLVTRSQTQSSTNRDGDVDASANGDGAEDEEVERPRRGGRKRAADTPQRRLLQLIDTISKYLCAYEEDGEPLAGNFQRLPHKAALPDYYAVIGDNATAFSTVRQKLMKKSYTQFSEFVRDVGQICHNAQVYNRPSAPVFSEAVRLREVFKEKLQELIEGGTIQPNEALLPDFGELPPVEDTPPPGEDDLVDDGDGQQVVDEEDDEDEEEEEEEEGDSDDSRRRGRKRRRITRKDEDDEDYGKKRGRPPKVFTPTEARINAILKGLRKPKDRDGNLRVLQFEKLPDKQSHKEYYDAIPDPIALDQIKRNAKRKKYRNVDGCMADLELMFENAKRYNEDDSDIYADAMELQKEARRLADQEKAKSDEAFRDEEGKLPLSEVEHKGEMWRVGDWVHISNSNDLQKPIVAQIYRVWQDKAGKQWINACWYYRPEQTVHRVTKRFHKNEVMKTGQYRDHPAEDIVDRCFVMFHTRYHKGRPRGFPADKEVYVCEARYNEQTFVFNRIKTWTSCLPDEVREKDYEMDLFAIPHKLKKDPTPIAHLLADNAKESDPLPKPNWGFKDAPPIIGGVHIRPREPNDSPSPEPTPEPPAVPPPAMASDPIRRPSVPMPQATAYQAHAGPVPSPSAAHQFQQSHFAAPQQHQHSHQHPHQPQHRSSFQPQPQPQLHHQQQVPSPAVHHVAASSSHFAPQQHPAYQQQAHFVPSPVAAGGHHHQIPNSSYQPAPFAHHHASAVPQPRMMPPTQSNVGLPQHANAYIPPRQVEVYTLREQDAQIPPEVRERYHTDDEGRVLFFTAPPLNRPHPGVANSHATLGHSVGYLSGLAAHKAERQRKRRERDEQLARDREEQAARDKAVREQMEKALGAAAGNMLGDWILGMQRENEVLEQQVAPIKAERAAREAEKAGLAATATAATANGTNSKAAEATAVE
ncbi:unnamed protein product [Discula destructiva]